ncbi:Asp-tRNA(Asn)/Glu-tRNA(Gln) amidotransferase subunit GatA [Candidatus Nomurabacteria bacterium]|nr:Asp-tRNA(Asn)/Glu-tRNA(Gln) amidotransferase subunit GatA [Candidatus Nomurabacteria bacterium]
MIDLKNLTIEKAHNHLKNGDFTVTDLVNEYLNIIKEKNGDINAYIEVYDDVLEQAKIAEGKFKDGTATLMTGIPIALKDNMLRDGFIASASSKILENYKATYDSFVVKELKEQGVVFLGRTNMDEFAMGSSTETSAYGVTKNPLDTSRVPGGSSGGSVAAVAMDGALCALGSDTGGSIRQPASFCNLVGLKTTYGSVSRSGIIAMGSSLDQVGPIGKTVRDTEIIFEAINGYDKMDATSTPIELRLKPTILKKRIGIPREFLKGDGIDNDVLKNFDEACKKLKNAGYELVDVSLPLIKYSLAVYYILQPAEVSSNLARYDGIRYGYHEAGKDLLTVYTKSRGKGFGKEVRRRIILGTYILSHGYYDAYYNASVLVRKAIRKELMNAFLNVDAIITPTSPFPPFKFGEKSKNPVSMYISDIFLAPANIAGIPAISVPSGTTNEGLPLGLQIMAPFLREDILFTIGKDFEKLV